MSIKEHTSIFVADSIKELDFNQIKNNLDSKSIAVIRGLISKKDIDIAINKIKEYFSREKDNPTIGESPKDIQKNFQKLLIGGHTHSGLYLTRFFRTFYNPLWAEDIFKMHHIYRLMIKIRNLCADYPENFAIDKIEENGLWSATRIHQYPTGGGYFAKHKDSVLSEVSNKHKLKFFQVILNMTKYGVDFEQGGAFIEINGEKIIFEKEFEVGDIIIYDENTMHGVDEIDIHKNLNLDSICGRLTAFVSIYKNMN